MHILQSMKLFIDVFVKFYSKYDYKQSLKNKYTKAIRKYGYRMKKFLTENKMFGFFSRPKSDETFVLLRQSKYNRCFLIIYLGHLDELITGQLYERFGPNWKENKIGYVISIEKILLDNVIGSKEVQQELVIGSGILQESDKYRKVRIVTQGEGILPIIQQKTGSNVGLRSYFVLAQIHKTYIHLTLNQVVKASTNKEHACSIIIQDEVIQIENVNDTLCKHIWINAKLNSVIDYCTSHKDKDDSSCNLYSL